jgi:hypothetical protein
LRLDGVFDTQKSISILPVYEQARDAKRRGLQAIGG